MVRDRTFGIFSTENFTDGAYGSGALRQVVLWLCIAKGHIFITHCRKQSESTNSMAASIVTNVH